MSSKISGISTVAYLGTHAIKYSATRIPAPDMHMALAGMLADT